MSIVSKEAKTINVQNRVFLSVTNEWTFQDHLPSETICLKAVSGRPEQWMCKTNPSPESMMNSIFKTIFQVKLSFYLGALCTGRTDQWTCRTESFPTLLTNGLFNTIFLVNLWQQFIKALSARGPEQWIYRGLPCVSNKYSRHRRLCL